MDIEFNHEHLRRLCESYAVAKKKLGTNCAKKLRTRLSDLQASQCVTELVAGDPHPLKGDRDGEFAVSLADGWRLTFVPDHVPVPTSPNGKIDWSKVNKIRIVFIGDYHD